MTRTITLRFPNMLTIWKVFKNVDILEKVVMLLLYEALQLYVALCYNQLSVDPVDYFQSVRYFVYLTMDSTVIYVSMVILYE